MTKKIIDNCTIFRLLDGMDKDTQRERCLAAFKSYNEESDELSEEKRELWNKLFLLLENQGDFAEVIDILKEEMRTRHILRLQEGSCSIDVGFVWSDILTNLERTSDHCSNIAGCIIDIAGHNMNIHESLREFRNDNAEFRRKFNEYMKKYALAGTSAP